MSGFAVCPQLLLLLVLLLLLSACVIHAMHFFLSSAQIHCHRTLCSRAAPTPGPPTTQGSPPPPGSGLAKAHHARRMTSLTAVRSRDELLAWASRLRRSGLLDPDAVTWVLEPKVDGLAVRVLYRCARCCPGVSGGVLHRTHRRTGAYNTTVWECI
jgi:NAD-dependent DNA ligase adenylation domain